MSASCPLFRFSLYKYFIYNVLFILIDSLGKKGKVDRNTANHCAAAVPWCLLFLPPVLFCVPRRAGAGDKRHGQLHYHALYLLTLLTVRPPAVCGGFPAGSVERTVWDQTSFPR